MATAVGMILVREARSKMVSTSMGERLGETVRSPNAFR